MYLVRKVRKNSPLELSKVSHASYDCNGTLCGMVIDDSWYILENQLKKENWYLIKCKKCKADVAQW